MKIVIGKFSNAPFHALSKKDVSLLLKLALNEWVKHVTSVVLSSKIIKKTKLTKPVEYITSTKQLSIFSRGLVRENIAREVLLELAKIAGDNAEIATDLDKVIKPYLDKFVRHRI